MIISREEFVKKYRVSSKVIDVQKCYGWIPKYVFSKALKTSYIDEGYFIRRREFKKKVWLESHDMYYFLTLHTTSFDLAKMLHDVDNSTSTMAWSNFLNGTLFNLRRESILDVRISLLSWKFYRYARWLIRGLFVLNKTPINKRDINILLDKVS